MAKPCLDCGTPTTIGSHCPACRQTTAQRGYGAQHQARRRAWAIRIGGEPAPCVRCHCLITPADDWQLDHTDDRTGYLGPSHVDCNARAATAKREAMRRKV